MQKVDEMLRQWEIEIEFIEPFDNFHETINLDIVRSYLHENYHLLTEEQKKKLQEIDKKALEIYYRNLNNYNKTLTQLIYEDIVQEYILGEKK